MARLVKYEESVKKAHSQNSLLQNRESPKTGGLDAISKDKKIKAFAVAQQLAQENTMINKAQGSITMF